MKQEINPKDTNRAIAFELWTKSPMPMVTLTKTFDVTRLRKVSRKRGMKFNMLLCWCIGKAASQIEEFYMLPKDGKLYKYDRMAINVIADNVKGGLSFCDSFTMPRWTASTPPGSWKNCNGLLIRYDHDKRETETDVF